MDGRGIGPTYRPVRKASGLLLSGRRGGRRGQRDDRARVHDDEEEPGLAGDLVADAGDAAALPGRGAELVHGDLEVERVARDDLAPEPGLVDAAEQREPAGVAVVGEHGQRADLGERLDDEHARAGSAGRGSARRRTPRRP